MAHARTVTWLLGLLLGRWEHHANRALLLAEYAWVAHASFQRTFNFLVSGHLPACLPFGAVMKRKWKFRLRTFGRSKIDYH